MKKTLLVAMTVGIATSGLASAAVAKDADGDNRACITKKEFKAIKLARYDDNHLLVGGTSFKRAKAIIDSKGHTIGFSLTEPRFSQAWPLCGSPRKGATISFGADKESTPKNAWVAVDKYRVR